MSTIESCKKAAAQAALDLLPLSDDLTIGVGTGSTVNFFIEAMAAHMHSFSGAVSSSQASSIRLQSIGIPLIDLNSVSTLAFYIDGADEVDKFGYCIKGGGGAHTQEKLVASIADQFICIVDERKLVSSLGSTHPLPIEVLPMARSIVGRAIISLGGDPVYREGFTTDNGNIIIDAHNLDINQPLALESALNNISGVVAHGLFAKRKADIVLVAQTNGKVDKVIC